MPAHRHAVFDSRCRWKKRKKFDTMSHAVETDSKDVTAMLDIFKNLDVLGILRLGLAGLCFLLSLLAFFLIYREQGREGMPRVGITRAIYTFMAVNLVTAIIVGTAGLVATQQTKKGNTEVPIKGQLEEPEAKEYSVIFKGMIGMAQIMDGGFFEQKCPKDVNAVILEFGRAGVAPEQFPLYLDQLSDKPLIFKLAHTAVTGSQRVAKPAIDSAQIAPTTEQLPPLQIK